MGDLGNLIGDFVRWLCAWSPWVVKVKATHAGVLFRHVRYYRLIPKWLLRRLPWTAAKWIVGHTPFATKSRTICQTFPLSAGYFWYWPKISDPEIIPVKRQTLTTKNQSISTLSGETVAVQAQIIYEVEDTILACCHTFDYLETIADISQLAVVLVVAAKTADDFKRTWHTREVRSEFTRRVRKELRPFGIYVIRAFFSQCSNVQVIRLLSDAPISGSFIDGHTNSQHS